MPCTKSKGQMSMYARNFSEPPPFQRHLGFPISRVLCNHILSEADYFSSVRVKKHQHCSVGREPRNRQKEIMDGENITAAQISHHIRAVKAAVPVLVVEFTRLCLVILNTIRLPHHSTVAYSVKLEHEWDKETKIAAGEFSDCQRVAVPLKQHS